MKLGLQTETTVNVSTSY